MRLALLPLLWTGAEVAHTQVPLPRAMDAEGLVAVDTYDEDHSRRLFASADRNADDRLDLFEAGSSLETLDGVRDRPGFRRLDRDRDGFLSWPEFDALLRRVLEVGGAFYFTPSRIVLLRIPQSAPPEQAEPGGMELLDQDRSGTLSRTEIKVLLATLGLPPQLIEQFPVLDLDSSGELSKAESAPLAALLESFAGQGSQSRMNLPRAYRQADHNGDGHLDRLELDHCLRALDPGLGRWTDKVLKDADPDRSGTLEARELQRAEER